MFKGARKSLDAVSTIPTRNEAVSAPMGPGALGVPGDGCVRARERVDERRAGDDASPEVLTGRSGLSSLEGRSLRGDVAGVQKTKNRHHTAKGSAQTFKGRKLNEVESNRPS